MNIPGFTAEAALYKTDSDFCFSVQSADLAANAVTPAIPFCGNCDYILDVANGTAGGRASVWPV